MEEIARSALPWVAGILLCAAVTVMQLHEQYRSWPFGDVRFKAAVLWAAMCMLDIAVGVLFSAFGAAISMAGPLEISLVGQTYWGPAILVPMIPLALRSPVRKVEIAGQEVSVGITEYYDRARLSILRRIDDRQTALVRSRNYATARDLMASGLSFIDFEREAHEHFSGLKVWTPAHLKEMTERLNAVSTLPTEVERFRGLVSLLREQQLESIIEQELRARESN